MESNQSPFAHFYDQVFTTSTLEEQSIFLRQLFTIDGRLCNSYYRYINYHSVNHPVKELVKSAKEESSEIKKRIIAHNWENLFQIIPGNPEDYIEEVGDILRKEFFDNIFLLIEANFGNGDILIALKNLRIIELSLDFDWEEMLEEPASYYQDEINTYEIESEFNYAEAYMGDGIFSIDILKVARDLILNFIASPMQYKAHTGSWKQLLGQINERISSLQQEVS